MYYIGIDLGGTNIAAGIVEEKGKIICKKSIPTLAYRSTDEIVADMAKLIGMLIEKGGISTSEIKSIGIGCPGTIDIENGVVIYSNNIPMKHYPMADKLYEWTGLQVYIDNDANCAALGEYAVYGEGVSSFMLITLGTGVGGGLILNGSIYHGFNGAAAEPGHMTIVSGGEECSCGKRGCWEAYASATALIRLTKEAMKKNPQSLMNKIAAENDRVTGKTVFDAVLENDGAAKAVLSNYIRYLSDGIVNVENMLQPEIIAIGGGVSHAGETLFAPVREYVRKYGFNKYLKKAKIVSAKLGNDAGIVGAALLNL
ncbi:MAG: ROK family glucokinase [Clostridia bacterium]|nr:ROK family glucokinase [Clostridia bacterium]